MRQLRRAADLGRYTIRAADGTIGRLEELYFDDQDWVVRYLEVDTRNWWPGKKVLGAPTWIESISWPDRTVLVNLTREAIRSAPAYDPSAVIGREYEVQLFKHHARSQYWN